MRKMLITAILALGPLPSAALAQTPAAILPADTVSTFGGYKGADDTIERIPAGPGVPFAEALRVDRRLAAETTFDAALIWQTTGPVRKGDLLIATYYVRNSGTVGQALRVEVSFQLSSPPYTPTLQSSTPVDTAGWQRYSVPYIAAIDFPTGQSSLQFRYGVEAQRFDIGGVGIVNHGQTGGVVPPALVDGLAYYYPDRGNPQAAWRTAALASIEATRKGTMTVRVTRSDGTPVVGARLSLAQTRPLFAWGSAVSAELLTCNASGQSGGRSCGAVASADVKRYRQTLVTQFDSASLYNDLKWPDWERDRQLAVDGLDWLVRNNLRTLRGHTLLWPSFANDYQLPSDLSPATPPAVMKARIDGHIAEELGALKGRIREWDVLNEPYTNYDIQGRIDVPGVTPFTRILPTSEVASWYKDARRADPAAVLFLNDFAIFEGVNPAARRYDLALVEYLQGLGAPVDAMGFQGHFNQTGPVFADMARTVADFSPLVKAFAVTEFDFTTLDPKLQADLMGDVMTFVFGSPKFTGMQMWGFWDGDHWLGNGPLYDRAWQLKPSGKVWSNLTKRTWRTQATLTSDGGGRASLRAFHGRYRITLTTDGKTCSVLREFGPATETVSVPACS